MWLPPTRLRSTLEDYFSSQVTLEPGERLLVAFSGGPDSTALLAALAELQGPLGIRIEAAHLDHGLDPDSARRARVARELASQLGVALHFERGSIDPSGISRAGGLEAAARAERYRFLDRARRRLAARYIVTAHHRDDQVETVLLRLLGGSGLRGIGGMRPVETRVLRPLLSLPRTELVRELDSRGLSAVHDPTNQWLGTSRNRVRAHLAPLLRQRHRHLDHALVSLAEATRGAMHRLDLELDALLAPLMAPAIPGVPGGLLVRRTRLESLADDLLPVALGHLHRRAGAPLPATAGARAELQRQMSRPGRVGCDAGTGWRWERSGDWYSLRKKPRSVGVFSYTCPIPGMLSVPELDLVIRVERQVLGAASKPSKGTAWTAALAFPGGIDEVRVRNRRPGDRIQPIQANGDTGFPLNHEASRSEKDENRPRSANHISLNEVLARMGVPPSYRDCVPLFCIGDRVAWLPGLDLPGPGLERSTPNCHYEELEMQIEALGGEPQPHHRRICSEGFVTTGAAPSR